MKDKTSERIKQSISNSGLTLLELQKLTNISKSAIQRYASGSTDKIPVDAVKKIANATNVSAMYLMGWQEDKYDTKETNLINWITTITNHKNIDDNKETIGLLMEIKTMNREEINFVLSVVKTLKREKN